MIVTAVLLILFIPLGFATFMVARGRQVVMERRSAVLRNLPSRGKMLDPKALQGKGPVYFVPIGPQAIPLSVFAQHYKDKFGLDIKVLPAIPLPSFAKVPTKEPFDFETSVKNFLAGLHVRGFAKVPDEQYDLEALHQQMERVYEAQSGEDDATILGITDANLYDSIDKSGTFSRLFERDGIVSTQAFGPAFWPEDPQLQVKRTEQMLTKYIAEAHYNFPLGNDPRSLLHSPLFPDGGPDDLYASDLHPEETAFGLSGHGDACISYQYHYHSGSFVPDGETMHSCVTTPGMNSPDDLSFIWYANYGAVAVRSMDLSMRSLPPIELDRAYISNYLMPFAFGIGTNYSYNAWLAGKINSYADIINEQGSPTERFTRVSPEGILPVGSIFRDMQTDDLMTWDGTHFNIERKTGVKKSFLGCGRDSHCYWDGYTDPQGHSLVFTRGSQQQLTRLRATQGQGLDFQYDPEGRVTSVKDTDGHSFRYEYNSAGTLSKIFRPDGSITLYTYDSGNHLTSFAVAAHTGSRPKTFFTNEYDEQNRIVKVTLFDGRIITLHYNIALNKNGETIGRVRVDDSTGPTFYFKFDRDYYDEWVRPARTAPASAAKPKSKTALNANPAHGVTLRRG